MKKVIRLLLTLILITIVGFGIYRHQRDFTKLDEHSKEYILDYNLGNYNSLLSLLYSVFSEQFIYTIQTQSLAINIDNSISYGKNNWLSNEGNQAYIKKYADFYNIIGGPSMMLFDKIVADNYIVNEENREFYLNLILNNISRLKEGDFRPKVGYKEFNESVFNTVCQDFPQKYRKHNEDYNELYKKLSLYFYNKKDYRQAVCYNALSGYNNRLAGWHTLHFGFLLQDIQQRFNTLKEEKSKEEMKAFIDQELHYAKKYYNNLIVYITNKDKYLFHRHSNDIMEVRNLNRSYNLFTNSLKQMLIY